MAQPNVAVDTTRTAMPNRRHLTHWLAGALVGALLGGTARSSSAKKKGGNRKKRVCRCAIGFHCEKGKCVADA